MNRDTVKTLAGLVVIAVIVVATFLYGNAQRQSQLKNDAKVKQQQANQVAQASPAGTGTAAPSASGQAKSNTAPVQSPGSSALQGGSSASPSAKSTSTPTQTPKPTATPSAKPASTPGQVAGAQTTAPSVPQTGGSTDPLPQTGPSAPVAGVVGLAAIVSMGLWLRRSKRAVLTAARNNR